MRSYKVKIDRVLYHAPTRRNHVVRVPRKALFRSGEDVRDANGHLVVSGIVCDACNTPIMEETVRVLILDLSPWGALCATCKEKYHRGLPEYLATPTPSQSFSGHYMWEEQGVMVKKLFGEERDSLCDIPSCTRMAEYKITGNGLYLHLCYYHAQAEGFLDGYYGGHD
jgi:hypothetical protein